MGFPWGATLHLLPQGPRRSWVTRAQRSIAQSPEAGRK